MTNKQEFSAPSLARRLSSVVPMLALLFLHCTVFADSLLPVRIADKIDQVKFSEIKNENLSTVAPKEDEDLSPVAKMDEKGDFVISCLNRSLPLAHNPFKNNPGMQKLMQHVRLEINPCFIGAVVKLTYLF